jgi:phage baseplate assembly protein W
VIKIDSLKRPTALDNAIKRGFIFKDLKLDLDASKFVRSELYSQPQPRDLSEIQDAESVINSVKNILTTAPGEKLLNPKFGLDLKKYIFEPINTTTSYFIATDIYYQLGVQEPRVTVENVTVEGSPDNLEIEVDITFSIPLLEIFSLSLKTTLNRDGYIIV